MTEGEGESWKFLRLLQLASPALPIGAFAYSQGLESAVAARLVTDEASAADWIVGLLGGSLATWDLPVFVRVQRAFAVGDRFAARRWSAVLLASRATAELEAEDRQLGTSLARVLITLGVEDAAAFVPPPSLSSSSPSSSPPRAMAPTFAGAFALGAARFGLPPRRAAEALAFTWAEAQTSAAVRLVPLGQSAGVRILATAAATIPAAVSRALSVSDEDVGGAAPAQALLSSGHEAEYMRLFRS